MPYTKLLTAQLSNMGLTTTGVTGASITSMSADTGATRTVTVNTGTGDGTIRLNVTDDDTIVDSLTNPLGGMGTGNGDYTEGDAYTMAKQDTDGDGIPDLIEGSDDADGVPDGTEWALGTDPYDVDNPTQLPIARWPVALALLAVALALLRPRRKALRR